MMQALADTPSDYLNDKSDAALKLGTSERNVDRLIRAGELPVVQISERRVGILQSDLEAFWRARRHVRGAPAAVEAAQSEQA